MGPWYRALAFGAGGTEETDAPYVPRWTSTSGADGDLPPITRSTHVPRAVDEVQGIVVR